SGSEIIGLFHGRIEGVMCCGEVWVQPVMVGVVHLRNRGVRIHLASIENTLSQISNFDLLSFRDFWPDKVVVDSASRIAIVRLQTPSDGAHPGIMYTRM